MTNIITSILGLAIFVGIFFLLRNFFCWYYKINDIISLKKENNELQRENNELLEELVNLIKKEAQK